MAKLVYTAITSLDGYEADAQGAWDFSVPDAEVHRAVNAIQARAGTMLLGRRTYDVLSAWETLGDDVSLSEPEREYAALWRGCDKVVYSRTLAEPRSARTTLVDDFLPAEVALMKETAERDLLIGGPGLAGQALAAGLVDEVHLFASPVLVGGGLRGLPDGVRLDLELLDVRRFGNGVVHSAYAVRGR